MGGVTVRALLGASVLGLAVLVHGAVQPAGAQDNTAAGLAAWDKVFDVFSHPRCVNCHVPDDNRPRWSGPSYGAVPQYHGQNIIADASRERAAGLPCTSCHTKQNLPFPHGAPGAPGWALAPVEMTWWDKSSAEICAQVKDPARNGGRSVEEVAEHVGHDALVAWGWSPGPGREPAPYSAREAMDYLLAWQGAGAPCPAPAAGE